MVCYPFIESANTERQLKFSSYIPILECKSYNYLSWSNTEKKYKLLLTLCMIKIYIKKGDTLACKFIQYRH